MCLLVGWCEEVLTFRLPGKSRWSVCLLVCAPFIEVPTFHLAALGLCKKKPPAICLLVGLWRRY
jgi:hypothetical protein